MLACDGTHIGVSVKNMLLDPAVTEHDDKNPTLKSVHKRNNRLILQDKTHQKQMHYLARKFLKKLKPSEILHAEVEEEKTAQLLNYAHQNCFNTVYELLVVFSHNLQKKDTLHVIAWLLLMFSGDSAMSSDAPFQSHDLLLSMCDNAIQGIVLQNQVEEINMYCIELAQLIVLGKKNNCTTLCVNFITSLVHKIQEVYQKNRPHHQLLKFQDHTIHLVEQCTTSRRVETNYAECQNMKFVQDTRKTMHYLVTTLKWMTHATRGSPKCQNLDLDTCSYGSAQSMGTAMDFILFQGVKGEKILLHHCTSIAMKCQATYTTIFLANCLSTFWTENQSCSRILDSGMTYFTLLVMHVA